MSETRYGFISDVHSNPHLVDPVIGALKEEGIDRLILNGDIGNIIHKDSFEKTKEASQEFTARILYAAAESGIETYVQPGSHEAIPFFQPVLDSFSEKYQNIHSTFEVRKIEEYDHHIIFLPGSDTLFAGAEYKLTKGGETGMYMVLQGGVRAPFNEGILRSAASEGKLEGLYYHINMEDLRELVTEPEKTIVVCHVPAKFNSKRSVDFAYYAIRKEGGILPGVVAEIEVRKKIEKLYGKIPIDESTLRLEAASMGFFLREENVGNQDLKDLFEELNIRKAINGHIHEAGHHAHDWNDNLVEPNRFVDQLFWNSGCFDAGEFGTLIVKDGKVAYQNLGFKT